MDINLEHYSDLISLSPNGARKYTATWAANGVYIGDVMQEVDGFFVFYPDKYHNGAYTETYALAIGAVLAPMNEAWREELSDIS